MINTNPTTFFDNTHTMSTIKTFLQENQIIIPSYPSYGGMAGFQDYGINGCKLKNKVIRVWKEYFLHDNVHEVEIPSIMPHTILKASGHVDRFTDMIVTDNSGIVHRADHLAKKWFQENDMKDLENSVDSWNLETLQCYFNKFGILDGRSDVVISEQNLMIDIHPSYTKGSKLDYLRPELAQGIFVNFSAYKSYLQPDCNSAFKPFGIVQIGKSYRKEISPQPYIRLKEFTQIELEYFVDPEKKTHAHFENSNICIPILSSDMQKANKNKAVIISVSECVDKHIISHSLMAYFLAKIFLFAKCIGLHTDKIRFREHLPNEMAHYANQCWDLECFVNGSWLECIGCADRGSYDLTAHNKANPKNPVFVQRKLNTPIFVLQYTIVPDIKKMRQYHPDNTNNIKQYFKTLDQPNVLKLVDTISTSDTFTIVVNDSLIYLASTWVTITKKETIQTHEPFIPHVIEPSFGVDRLLFAIMDQNLWHREIDERRLVLSLPYELQLFDVAVFPLHKKDTMIHIANNIRNLLMGKKFTCYMDDTSTAIGKKYVRCDEIGVPYVITVDPGTIKNQIVTIRDRETMNQSHVPIDSIISFLEGTYSNKTLPLLKEDPISVS